MSDSRPESCSESGLSCRACIEGQASTLSQICTGMRGNSLRGIFFQIYPDPGCAPMLGFFERLYVAQEAERQHPAMAARQMAAGAAA